MEDNIMNLVVVGVISWSTIFLLTRRVFPKLSFDFSNRVVSTIHATLAVILASLTVQDWRCPVCPLASKSSPKQMQTLAMSLSYMIYDMVCCLFDKQVKLDNSIHHLVSIVGFGAGLAYKKVHSEVLWRVRNLTWHRSFDYQDYQLIKTDLKCGSEMVVALWITEISSPFLHLRELLKELGYKDTDLSLVADILFAVIFTFARMGGGPYLTYVTLVANNPFLIKAMALGLQLVSAFWFYKIVLMVRYKLTKRTSTKVA
ncbi:TLC domain-containing protein 5-like isoform X1 [Quercus lobata]|uniref:TLC domain-containing protein 5-like isoform X1 n=1 Tax=Quercus lobata TaxID=97700 RepID=UPI0012486135|nr:TLC domain-containing protein 5-like isoform X1 [Quercus lobata]